MIRVVRILEYIYETNEIAESDMSNWKLAPNGSLFIGKNKRVRSTIITDFTFRDNVEQEL